MLVLDDYHVITAPEVHEAMAFLLDHATDQVHLVIATRAVTAFAGAAGATGGVDGTGAVARFTGPNAIATDGGGNLYVGDGNGTVRRIAIDSATVSTVIGSPGRTGVSLGALPAALNVPYGIVVLPTGDLAIVDTVEDSILIGHLK